MSELVQYIFAAFGGSAASVAILGWLARSWLSHALEIHKLELEAKLDASNRRTIAELEATLRITEARVSKLH